MNIRLKASKVYGETIIMAACPVSHALFELIQNRKTLKTTELHYLGKMGYEIEIIGDTHPLALEFSKKEINYTRDSEKMIYNPKSEV
jgi:hypothetical protein